MDPTLESRLARAEQLLVTTVEAVANLQSLASETRSDLAHMSEWAGQVTEAIAEGRLIQQQLTTNQLQMAELLRTLAAGQERQEAILMELIRQRGQTNGSV